MEKFVYETNNLGFSISALWIYTTLREIAKIQHILRNTTISFNLKVFRILITTKSRGLIFSKTQKISTASDQYFLSYVKKKLQGGVKLTPPPAGIGLKELKTGLHKL